MCVKRKTVIQWYSRYQYFVTNAADGGDEDVGGGDLQTIDTEDENNRAGSLFI